ncbi:MAG: UDP-galactopyranose mutase [Nanoarchaeota archaeon]|nr:UDP-galactopyranose mutase [Nanoarchaeota archaeon]
MLKKYDYLVVGAGFSGATIAERLASKGKKVLVIDQRNHVGGNCHDRIDRIGYVQEYGPHIFHTSDKEVWDYISQFTSWHPYRHKVLADINGKLVPLPFNLNSIKICFDDLQYKNYKDLLIKKYGLNKRISVFELMHDKNKDVRKLGDFIYSNIFFNYTKKQWDIDPEKMERSVLDRVPVVVNDIDAYFNDEYQGIPEQGYSKIIEKMLKDCDVHLETDFFGCRDVVSYDFLIFTGRIDSFFGFSEGEILYRNIEFRFDTQKNPFQKNSVINYPSLHYPYTRITEFNKFLNIKSTESVIAKEYPSWEKGFVAYPVQTRENLELIGMYRKKADKLKNIFFAGRLAEGRYLDMDKAIRSSLDLFEKLG